MAKTQATTKGSSGSVTAASTAEINAQTDNTKMATPSNLKGSMYDVATKLYLHYNFS